MKTIFSWGMLLLSAVLVLISHPPAAGRHFRVRRGTATAKTVTGTGWHHCGDRQAGRARQENSSMNPADRSNHARDRPAQEVAAALYKLVVEQLPDAVIVSIGTASSRHGTARPRRCSASPPAKPSASPWTSSSPSASARLTGRHSTRLSRMDERGSAARCAPPVRRTSRGTKCTSTSASDW